MTLSNVKYYRSVVEAHSGAAMVVSALGKIVAVNDIAHRRFGFCAGQSFCNLFDTPTKAKTDLKVSVSSPANHLFALTISGRTPLAFFGSQLFPDPFIEQQGQGNVLLRVESESNLSERFNTVPPGQLEILNQRLQDEIRCRQALEIEKASLEKEVQLDKRTQLLTSVAFDEALKEHARIVPETAVAVVFLDLDEFKRINDRLGHDAGDCAIRHVGKILRENLRKNDFAARLGGDEFAIALIGAHSRAQVEQFVVRLHTLISTPIPYIDPVSEARHRMHLSFSAGIALYPKNTRDISLLVKYADRAMYNAKLQSNPPRSPENERGPRPQ